MQTYEDAYIRVMLPLVENGLIGNYTTSHLFFILTYTVYFFILEFFIDLYLSI